MVTVIGEPAVTAYPVAVRRPPAPPPPPNAPPPPPPPATTRYSTEVGIVSIPSVNPAEIIPPIFRLDIKTPFKRFLPKKS
jgi:hypothetical protein